MGHPHQKMSCQLIGATPVAPAPAKVGHLRDCQSVLGTELPKRVFLSRKQVPKFGWRPAGHTLPLGPGAPGRFHEAGGGLHGPHSCSPSCPAGSQTQTWAEGFSNTVASLQTQGFSLGTGLPGGRRLARCSHPTLPTKSLGEADPRAWGPAGVWSEVASVGTVGPLNPQKIILSANSHFPRKRRPASLRSIPFSQKAFDFTQWTFSPSGSPTLHTSGATVWMGSCPCWGWERGTKGEGHAGLDNSWGFKKEGTQGMEGTLGQGGWGRMRGEEVQEEARRGAALSPPGPTDLIISGVCSDKY